MIAALFVERGGAYFGLPDVDPWDESRDARLYAGPWPVVAHPPCARWCRLAHLVQARYGHAVGDDAGAFASALASVRRWGGVLEHPAWSLAWAVHGLLAPNLGGWARDALDPARGWVCEVSQAAYGHPAVKATWLYYVGEAPPAPLTWGRGAPSATVSWCSNHSARPARVGGFAGNGVRTDHALRPRLSPARASATPPAFAAVLLDLARRSP